MEKSTPTATTGARAENHLGAWAANLCDRVQEITEKFLSQPAKPVGAYDLEKELKVALDAAGLAILEKVLNGLEADDREKATPKVRLQGDTFRINKKTRAKIASIFGTIELRSWLYLATEDGAPGLHPLHRQLGIVGGTATALLAERVGRWAVDFSQREVRLWLRAEHGLNWSNQLLRKVLREFRRGVIGFLPAAQAKRLLGWLKEAEESRGPHRPVLAVGRDGVMIPMRGLGYQEASAGTVSVYDRRRRRRGTVYLGQMPEKKQLTLSADLTALVRTVLGKWSGKSPRLVYVTDKGNAQEDYFRRVLRGMQDPRQPDKKLSWEWVLDFFHVCAYVGKLREALFGEKGQRWFQRMRQCLRQRHQGVTQIIRSAMQHYHRVKISKAAREDFWKAYGYLRNNSHWMDYARYLRQGLPIGSGVTEAACKTVFTQRFKRSGMRWKKESGQVILDLRVLYLSGVWDEVVRQDLHARCLPERLSSRPRAENIHKKAA